MSKYSSDVPSEPVFSSRRAAELAGITGFQLHAWAAAEAAVPSIDPGYRQGRPKKWSFSDLVGLRVLRELIGAGMPIPMLSNVIPCLRVFTHSHPGLHGMAGAWLVLYGNGDVQITDSEETLSILVRASTGTILRALVIELGPAVREVERMMRRAQLHDDLALLEEATRLFSAA